MNPNEINTNEYNNEDVVHDTYVVIEIWTRPLGRHRYHASEIINRRIDAQHPGSSLLTESLRQSPNIRRLSIRSSEPDPQPKPAEPVKVKPAPKAKAEQVQEKEQREEDYFDLGSRILSETPQEFLRPTMPKVVPEEYEDAGNEAGQDSSNSKKKKKDKPKKVSIKVKLRNKLYDYTEIKLEEMEEKVDELINKDGFYDEVIPIDANVDYHKKGVLDMRFVILFGALALVTAALIYVVKSF